MSTSPDVPYHLEFSVEVPGTPEQVWQAIATAVGMSGWFLPTALEERAGGSLHFDMGPEMGSDGHITDWEPPRRLVYEEDWASLMGKEPDAVSPLTSEFIVEARSGGTCVVHVTSSGFGRGADWESEFWAEMEPGWLPSFDNLRLYLSDFAGQAASFLQVEASGATDAGSLWKGMREAIGLGEEGSPVELNGASGTVVRVGDRHALVRLHDPVPGMLNVATFAQDPERAPALLRVYAFSDAAPEYVRREEPGWQSWLDTTVARVAPTS